MQSHTEPSTERPNRLLIFTVLGFLGLILGMFVPFVAEIGMSMLSAGVLLWFVALLTRKDHKWSSEVNFYGEALVIISISINDDDTDDDIRDFRTLHGGNWTYAKDTQNLTDSYDITGVPTEFVVDVNDYIHYYHLGTTTAGVLSDEIEEARTGYAPPEIPYALIAIVIMVVVGVVSATVAALLWRRRG